MPYMNAISEQRFKKESYERVNSFEILFLQVYVSSNSTKNFEVALDKHRKCSYHFKDFKMKFSSKERVI